MIPQEWLDQAYERLSGQVERTPVTEDADLGLYLKWENRQITGSFKLRGALNKVEALLENERQAGLVCASAGNHGQGVALAARRHGTRAVVFASDHTIPTKIQAMQDLGADVRKVAGGYAEAEAAGIAHARSTGMTWISPYNDVQVICGQSTLGRELLEQIEGRSIQAVYIPAGGGGLAAGVGEVFRQRAPGVRVIAVQSEASAYLHHLYYTGSQADVIESDSLADGLSGAVENGAMTIPLVRKNVDEFLLVSEEEIGRAIAFAWRRYGEKIEGSAAVALAAARKRNPQDGPAAVILSGGNIQAEVHAALLDRYPREGE